MLKNHPKGLLVAFFTNMGERFGFYTMMAILVLFLQARYGLSAKDAGNYYSWFYYAIYALALVGGMLADATNKYKSVIFFGQIIMFIGYALLAIPGMPLSVALIGLLVIAFGNGLFKGNLQAVVGQLYDDPKYSSVRDIAFMIFYMGINIGAFFAPYVANGVRNWFLETQGFLHDGSLPAMCHAFLDGRMVEASAISGFEALATKVSQAAVAGTEQLTTFANNYLGAFARGYNYAFGIAALGMIASLVVYLIFNKHLPNKEKAVVAKSEGSSFFTGKNLRGIAISLLLWAAVAVIFLLVLKDFALGMAIGLFIGFVAMIVQFSTKDELPKTVSLILVFVVVIFFWMSFHQNGLTLTYFARDYTVKEVGRINNIFFTLPSMLSFIAAVAGLILVISRKKMTEKLIGGGMLILGGYLLYLNMYGGAFIGLFNIEGFKDINPIAPEVFQSFNPLFIVVLTFPVMALFGFLKKKNAEPSTPKKIGIGMIIAAFGFVVILFGSRGLVSPHDVAEQELTDWGRVSTQWLISSYLILTIAELFLSPMGLSFVSKVAPGRFQGLMQGGWLLATATGNKLLFVGSYFWDKIQLWQLWLIFVICCLASAAFIFSILKRLEKATM